MQLGEVLRAPPELRRGDVLLQPAATFGAGDRHDVLATRQHPRQRQLPGGHAAVAGQPTHTLHDREVAGQVRVGEAGVVTTEVVVRQVVDAGERAGQEAATQRAVGDDPDAELSRRRHDLLLQLTAPQRPLGLQRRDGMRRRGSPQGVRVDLGQTEVSHLARLDQLAHGTDGVLDRHLRVTTVQVVEVDVVDAQATQRRVAGLVHVAGIAPDRASRGILLVAHETELGGQHDLVAAAADRPTHELLVRVRSVGIRGVQQRDAQVERPLDRRDRLGLVGVAVELGHAHAAQALGRHDQVRAQVAVGAQRFGLQVRGRFAHVDASREVLPRAPDDDGDDADYDEEGGGQVMPLGGATSRIRAWVPSR